MSLADLNIGQHMLYETDNLPERFKYLEHHDLLLDVLREEFEESVGQLRALLAESDPRGRQEWVSH